MSASLTARWSWSHASQVIPVGLAVGILALPLAMPAGRIFGGLSWQTLELVVLAFVLGGWIVTDRLIAFGMTPLSIGVIVVGGVGVAWVAAHAFVFAGPGPGQTGATVLVPAGVMGALIRGPHPGRRSIVSIVAIAAMSAALTFDLARVPVQPLRDLHLYLRAGADALAGHPLYLDAPLRSAPGPEDSPFVYPPLTIPLFELMARLPTPVVEVGWLVAAVGAALASLWLLGIRGRWLVVLIAWPPLALGLSVGNVAVFSLLFFVLGYRVGAALVLGGVFKLQSAVPALWLVREGRWRSLLIGLGILLVIGLLTLLSTGWQAWLDWAEGLWHFRSTTERFPSMKGYSLTRWFAPWVPLGLTLIGIAVASLGRDRNGLARFGVVSVVASPTLYLHGLLPVLPGALSLRPDLFWLVVGFSAGLGPGPIAWGAVALVAIVLVTARGHGLSIPPQLSVAEADVHPAGSVRRVWPDRNA